MLRGEPIPLKTGSLLVWVAPHTAINTASIGQYVGPFHVKFSALQNWSGVICSILWPEEVTEKNCAGFFIILNFGAFSNTSFQFLIVIWVQLNYVLLLNQNSWDLRETKCHTKPDQRSDKGSWKTETSQLNSHSKENSQGFTPQSTQAKQADGETSVPSLDPCPPTIYDLVQGTTHTFAHSSPSSHGRSHISRSNANIQHTAFARVVWTINATLISVREPRFKSINIRAQVWKLQ